MNNVEFTRQPAGQSLKSELARHCLPQSQRDPERKLAWMNSICLLFLLVGVAGSKPAAISVKPPPPIEEIIPVVVEPLPAPPVRMEAQPNPEPNNQERSDAAPVVMATPESPAINFSIPTIPSVIVPSALATAPPANPLRPIVATQNAPVTIDNTGRGGERPVPTYPPIAQQLGQQGTVLLTMTVDQNGSITAIEVKQSSGFPMLDRGALEFVKRHWILPAGAVGRVFEAPIRFVL